MKKALIFLTAVLILLPLRPFRADGGEAIRIAVLPFQNMDGLMDLNVWCYKLQDSVSKALKEIDPDEQYYRIVPADSIEMLLAEMNLDPNNPQYATDMWKVVKILNVTKVVSGNFNMQAKRILINAYIYDPATKLADPQHQAKDIFKKEPDVLEAVPRIVRSLLPGLKPE